jgi:AmmeMemoRadiSam system protein B
MQSVRVPAVAGLFYPAVPHVLRAQLDDALRAVQDVPTGAAPKVLVAPHAGYAYDP